MVVADPPGVSIPALDTFLRRSLRTDFEGPLHVELLSGGRSNLTYLLTDGHKRWVLRRPPLGHVLDTAHDVDREYRVLGALYPTDVPVPKPLISAGSEVIGAPFFLMEFAAGRVLRHRTQLEHFGAASHKLADELVEVLVGLHRVTPEEVGLGDLGRPDGYLDRQLRRWSKQLEASRSRELPDLVQLGDRLARRMPLQRRSALVHGDYRLDNVVVGDESAQIVGVLDWEMATQGDPLTDVASMLIWWDGIRGLDSPVAAVPGDVSGFPGGTALADAYATCSGWDLAELPWYLAFAYYKIAVIFEGIHYRAQQGLTVGDGFERLGDMVPALTERGHAALRTWP